MTKKPMLNSVQLIKHMQDKGIQFNITTTSEARYMLDNINYYFKLASYRVNFPKGPDGKYLNLDCAYLTDLASIDMQLRDYLLDLSLDIEHGIKVMLLHLMSEDPNEDGYQIVRDFKQHFPKQYHHTMIDFKNNRYEQDMYEKHHNNIPAWVLMEIITFGSLSQIVDLYYSKHPYKRIKPIHNHLKFSKNIRNACAHSNPLLLNLFSEREFLPHPSAAVRSAANLIHVPNNYLNDLKINDLVSTFYLHKIVQSRKMGEHRVRQGHRLIERFHRHEMWYADNTRLNAFFSILSNMIDYLN